MSLAYARTSAAFLLLALGCGSRTVTGGGTDGETDDGGDGPTAGEGDDGSASATAATTAGTTATTGGDDDSGEDTGPPPTGPAAVDILFVIDNSGSMGEEQGNLVSVIDSLTHPLEKNSIDYRVGITTTDNGNPWCSGTTPEGGSLRAIGCKSRLEEFIFTGTDPPTDKQQEACNDVCAFDTIDIAETTTDVDAMPRARPWVENIGGVTNLPDGMLVSDALKCLLPQGINGCGFEQPLESTYKALQRVEVEGEDGYGFMRRQAHLAIIFVTDEVDCSHHPDHDSIFRPDGGKVFWHDPDASYPTSAVCWNAGVSCEGGPGTYDDCKAANHNEVGAPTGEADAVLYPLSRYVNHLQQIAEQKLIEAQASVLIGAITGVPDGYGAGQELVYQDGDAEQQEMWGIGPGCESAAGFALPPVRLRELSEAFEIGERNLYSVCASSYGTSLTTIAEAILSVVP